MATALQSPNITTGLCLSQGDFENSFKPDHHHLPTKQIHVFEQDVVLDGHCAPVDLHDIGGGRIFVRDPPFPELLAQNHSRSLAHIYSTTQAITCVVPSFVTPSSPMAKKRRSLQSILIPSFLHSPPSSVPPTPSTPSTPELQPSRARSHSELIYHPPLDDAASRASPTFLLDDDPFANLSTAATQVTSSSDAKAPLTPTVSTRVTPRSPLSPCPSESANRLASPVRSSPAMMSSFPRTHLTHPAHKRPAFAPRPSLPSLHALAQMNAPLVLPRKHRKGKVGARLPFEPWELGSSISEFAEMVPGPPASMLSPRGQDFTSDLDTDFLDFTDDNDGDDDDFDDFDDPTVEAHFSASFDVNNEHSFQMQPLSQEHLDVSSESLSGADSSSSLSRSSSSSRSLSSSSSLSDSEDRICRDSQSRHSTSRRSDVFKHSTSGQPHSSSAESDSDIPNSPPDESYFIFPRSLSPDCLLVDEDHEELDGVGYEIGSGVDVPYHGLDRTPHHSIYFHHSNSLSMGSTDIAAFEPGSSEGTIRGSSFHAWALSRGRRHSNKWMTGDDDDEMIEGSEWQGGQNGHYSSNGSAGYYGGNSGYGRASGRSNGGFGGGSNWGNGGDDGDDRRGRRGREGHGHHTDPTSGSEEEQSESEDDYGVPSASQSKKTVPNDYSASDDDVPLAQRIPTALRAQKTIRRKVKEERDQRRRERAAKAALNGELHPPHPRTPLSPAGPSGHHTAADSQEPNVQTRSGRMRTMTMPSNSSRPFAVDDLSKRLEAMQIPEPQTRIERARSKSRSRIPSPDRNPLPMPEMPQLRRSKSRHPSPDRNPLPTHEPGRTLRPMRSFHRTETRPFVDRAAPPIPVEHQKLARSKTEGRSRRRDDLTVEHGVKSKSLNMQATETPDIDQFARGRRQDEGQSTTVHLSARQRSVSRPSRPSMDRDAYPVPRKSLQRQTPSPIPPLPLADIKTTVITQQRVFIGDMQSFNTVEISSNTTAQDVLDMVKAQGSLKQFVGSGGWMLFEVAQDFGMERPVRSFELLADVQASWNKDKMVNMFVIKMTSLTGILSRSNIPSSSPMHSGWVEWEAKRGKWTKRWMQLREHSLWLSKRDSGKDETFLCSLSNFDAYAVTRVHKAPKPYVFATKSTDNLSFFENTADYLHVFSCSQKDGEKWMEVILLARSYVLYQEKNVLFNPKAGSSTSGTGLSRSGTRKTPSGRTGQTFVDVSSQDVFVPGSLLHRKS